MATPGIRPVQTQACLRAHGRGAGCRCAKSYEAFAWDKREGKKVRKTFSGERAHSEAKAWRDSKTIELRQPGFTASGKTAQPLLRDAADAFLEAAETGVAESRNREPYKAATLRGYARDLARICDDLGAVALDELTPKDVRGLVGRLKASGASGQSVRNCIVSLQALYRFYRHDVTNPCRDIGADLPRPGQRRERAATPSEAAALLDALPEEDRALWGTAFYCGLRLGELRGLRGSDVDLEAGTISVSRGWDVKEGACTPKSRAGVRTIPAPPVLVELLRAHVKRSRRMSGDALLFGRADGGPFTDSHMRKRAVSAWAAAAVGSFLRGEPGDLEPIGFHECRHSYSSFLDAAGISETRADRYMGHSNASVQARYRHQLTGQLAEDAGRLDEYLRGSAIGKIATLPVAAAR